MKRVCQKAPVGRMGGGRRWVSPEVWVARSVNPEQKQDLKSFAHPVLTRTKSSVFGEQLLCRLSWDISEMNLLATVQTKPIK